MASSTTYRTTQEIPSSPLNSPNDSKEELLSDDEVEVAPKETGVSGGKQQPVTKDDCTEIGIVGVGKRNTEKTDSCTATPRKATLPCYVSWRRQQEGTDGRYTMTDEEEDPVIPAGDDDITADPPIGISNTSNPPNLQPDLPSADPSSELTIHGEKPSEKFSCSECGKCFSDPVTLLRHGRVHRQKVRFFCTLCGKGCNSKSDLVKHERVHTGEKPYCCTLCGKCYSQKSHLYTHGRVHTGEKPFACSQCLRRFSFKSQLIRHMRDHTGGDAKSAPTKQKTVKPQIVPSVEKTYSCTLCGKCFPLKSQLISHILNDTGDGPDSCSNRRKSRGLSLKEKLLVPRKGYSVKNTYACTECGKSFSLKSQLIEHARDHTAEEQDSAEDRAALTIVKVERDIPEEDCFACEECGKIFVLKSQLIKHVRIHVGVDPKSGADHAVGLAVEGTIVKVEKNSSEESLYSCAECGDCFSLKSQLVKHVRMHAEVDSNSGSDHPGLSVEGSVNKFEKGPLGEKLYSCDECGTCFSQKSQLIKHMRVHSGGDPNTRSNHRKVLTVNGKVFRPQKGPGEKPYSCDECGKGFVGIPDLARHKRMHIRGKPFHCSYCGKGCASKSDLTKHERVHTGEKPYPCSFCGHCFSQTSHLNQHQRIHTGVKPFSCLQCGKCYAFKSQLAKHERVHTEGKIYSCSKCTKIFSVEEERNQHERVHTEEKPYSCSVCGKCFHWKAAFIRHERAHAGQLPFTCTECGRGCSSRYDLIKHERVHTKERPYTCSHCGKCYSQKSHLNMHMKVHSA